MADLLTELFGYGIAGGLSGAMRANREEALREEEALARLLKEGKGYIPEQLLPFMEGYTRYPPEESQPFPWAEGESRVSPGRRWTYAESPQAKAERERTEGYQKKLSEVEGYDFYKYLRDVEKRSEGESAELYERIFGQPWIEEEAEKPTEVRRQWTAKQVNLVRKMFESGKVNQENYKKDLSPFAQKIAEDEGFVKAPEKPPTGKELGATEQRIITILQKKPSKTAKHNVLWMNRKGFEVDEEKDEWKPRTVTAQDFFEMFMGGGTSEETPEGKAKTPAKPEYYGATSLAELEHAIREAGFSEDKIKKILEDARNTGLK